jgi:type IV pilus assembly protein PilA
MKNTRSTKGFTLVEIMIVVVIIGLLAAMAVPAFQKVRQNSIEKTLTNDAKQIASAANQYFLETGATAFRTGSIPASGVVPEGESDLYAFVKQISKGNSFTSVLSVNIGFAGSNGALGANSTLSFSPDGQKL